MLTRHALRNSLVPVVTIVGLQMGALLGGAVVVENVFAWPGLGSLVVEAVSNRDYAVVQAAVLVIAANRGGSEPDRRPVLFVARSTYPDGGTR